MKGRWLWAMIGAGLAVLLVLACVFPQRMLAPGPLVPAHAALANDCFACHAPLRGPAADLCIACHVLADIGLRTTQGVAITAGHSGTARPLRRSFHQDLTTQDCMACHSDHAGPKLTQGSHQRFSHDQLREQARARCEACHAPPSNDLHRTWTDGCAQCHTTQAWKPATFKHDAHFLLDQDHNTACTTCHLGGDHSRYTCYGCHEHTPAKVRAQHAEEGIRNIEDCVACHRSADGERDGD